LQAANDNYISNGDYHDPSKTPGISASGLIRIARSPAHFKEYLEHPPEPTAAMARGSAIHTAILEPEKFGSEYTVLDDEEICERIGGAKPRATKLYKEWRAQWDFEHVGKKVLTANDYDLTLRIAEKVLNHPTASQLLAEPSETEGTLQWTDEKTGVQLKCRPDRRVLAGRLLDIKTTTDARPDAFSKSIFTYAYYLQASTYLEGVRTVCKQRNVPFTFIAVETDAPHGIAVYELDQTACELGDIEFRRCVDLYARCAAADEWPDYPTGIMPISVPAWGVQRLVEGI